MFKYRNTATGRVLERPKEDEWLELSSGWERVDDAPEPEQDEPLDETSDDDTSDDDTDERNDD